MSPQKRCTSLGKSSGVEREHKRPKRQTKKKPNPALYVGYCDDDEDIDSIMAKFARLEEFRQHIGASKEEHSASKIEESANPSGLTEDQLQQVFHVDSIAYAKETIDDIPRRKRRMCSCHKFTLVEGNVPVSGAEDSAVMKKLETSIPEDPRLANAREKSLETDLVIVPLKGIDPYTRSLILKELQGFLSDEAAGEFVDHVLRHLHDRAIRAQRGALRRSEVTLLGALMDISEISSADQYAIAAQRLLDKFCDSNALVAHCKGDGLICVAPHGIKKGDFIGNYVGEVNPAWLWIEQEEISMRESQLRGEKPAPSVYNIALERPVHDDAGYDVVFVDPTCRGGFCSRLSHSCDPNVHTCVVSTAPGASSADTIPEVPNILTIAVFAHKDIACGEEVVWDYLCRTDNPDEIPKAICLCGTQKCRGSFFYYSEDEDYMSVLKQKHHVRERMKLLLQACESSVLSPEDSLVLEKHGCKRSMLEGLPVWVAKFVSGIVRFLEEEQQELPKVLMGSQHPMPSPIASLAPDAPKVSPEQTEPRHSEQLPRQMQLVAETTEPQAPQCDAAREGSPCAVHASAEAKLGCQDLESTPVKGQPEKTSAPNKSSPTGVADGPYGSQSTDQSDDPLKWSDFSPLKSLTPLTPLQDMFRNPPGCYSSEASEVTRSPLSTLPSSPEHDDPENENRIPSSAGDHLSEVAEPLLKGGPSCGSQFILQHPVDSEFATDTGNESSDGEPPLTQHLPPLRCDPEWSTLAEHGKGDATSDEELQVQQETAPIYTVTEFRGNPPSPSGNTRQHPSSPVATRQQSSELACTPLKVEHGVNSEITPVITYETAEREAKAIFLRRLQSLAVTLDRVKHFLHKQPESRMNVVPFKRLSQDEMVNALWNDEKSVIRCFRLAVYPLLSKGDLRQLDRILSQPAAPTSATSAPSPTPFPVGRVHRTMPLPDVDLSTNYGGVSPSLSNASSLSLSLPTSSRHSLPRPKAPSLSSPSYSLSSSPLPDLVQVRGSQAGRAGRAGRGGVRSRARALAAAAGEVSAAAIATEAARAVPPVTSLDEARTRFQVVAQFLRDIPHSNQLRQAADALEEYVRYDHLYELRTPWKPIRSQWRDRCPHVPADQRVSLEYGCHFAVAQLLYWYCESSWNNDQAFANCGMKLPDLPKLLSTSAKKQAWSHESPGTFRRSLYAARCGVKDDAL
eukprot:Rmarinus@m.13935